MQLATGYWAPATVLAANELGVFGALADGPAAAGRVAEVLQLDPRATALMLDACVGLGLLAKRAGAYHATPAADALVPGRPGYLGGALRWSQAQYALWGRLAEVTRTGRPAVAPESHLGGDAEQTRTFVLAMHERAAGTARAVVPSLDLDGCGTLLDVGGPGTYAALLTRRHPALRVTILDLPGVCAVARELLDGAGLDGRVGVLAGDATLAEYGDADYDAVLFSGVLHQMSPTTSRRMLAGAHRALRPGGRVIVCDLMLDPTRTQPLFSTLFSLQMLLTSHAGAVFAAEECVTWLGEVGFTDVQTRPLAPLPYTVVRASKAPH